MSEETPKIDVVIDSPQSKLWREQVDLLKAQIQQMEDMVFLKKEFLKKAEEQFKIEWEAWNERGK